MIREALSLFPLKWMPLIGLGIFFTVFLGVLVWTQRKGSIAIYRSVERLPLNGEESKS